MSQIVPFNGSNYIIPTTGETGWSVPVTNMLSDLGNNAVTLATAQTISNKTISLAAGAVGSPAISFTANTTTGMYQPSTNQLALATNGAQRLLLDGSGNITVTGSLTVSGQITNQSITSNIGRNFLHNSMFRVQQRGTGPWTTTLAYTADRWFLAFLNGSLSVSIATLNDAARTAIGDETATSALSAACVGTSAPADFALVSQKIESVQRLSGKTVTVSFWALSTGATKLGVSIDQIFGTGGSPSATVNGTGQAVTMSTTWTRYSVTLAVPSASGKTFGTTAGTDSSQLNFWLSSGPSSNTRTGTIGVQSHTVQLWGVQLELGSNMSPVEYQDIRYDTSNCQRFYQAGQFNLSSYNAAGNTSTMVSALPVKMRAVPSAATTGTSNSNSNSFSLTAGDAASLQVAANAVALGALFWFGNYTLTADL